MSPLEFFKAVLPDDGWYCATSKSDKDKFAKQAFTKDINRLVKLASNAPKGSNAFFACSTFGDLKNKKGKIARTQNNVHLTKSLWVDLDIGEGESKYESQIEALTGLRDFCKELKLPKPLVVNSGGGVHAYWILDEAVTYDVWFPVASRLKLVALKLGLKIDVVCTSDGARILRVPGSLNYKYDPPKEVGYFSSKVVTSDINDIALKLSTVDVQVEDTPHRLPFNAPAYITGIDDTSRALMGGNTSVSNFMVLVSRGSCGQINNIVSNQADIPEPLWRAGLSIAHACEDGEEAIHYMSNKHPGYSRQATIDKANATVGPLTCKSFAELHPEICHGCKFWGKITSPIVLGRQAEVDENAQEEQVIDSVDEQGERLTYKIPAYPHPYIRGKSGEIIENMPEEDGGRKTLYPYPFYITARMFDPIEGEMLKARLHMPNDGVREFTISLREASSNDKFRDVISENGVAIYGGTLQKLRHYVLRWAQDLQGKERAELMRAQLGWTDSNTFVIGEREITEDSVVYSPPARSVASVAYKYDKAGSLEAWKNIANTFGEDGMESRAFVLFAGFGAALMKLTNLDGGVINLVSSDSGVGKTTLQYCVNSIWGHPKETLLLKDDTYNARIHRMGVVQSMPITMDEITNMAPEEASALIYAATQGRGKNRMEASSNEERLNNTTWSTIVISSSNSSLEDKISSTKSVAQGELMRLIEIEMEANYLGNKQETEILYNAVFSNYGHAGEEFMKYVVRNRAEVRSLLVQVKKRLENEANLTARERIWSAIASVALAGGMISKALGLHDIDTAKVARWVRNYLKEANVKLVQEHSNQYLSTTHLGAFLNDMYQHTLVINSISKSGMSPTIFRESKRELLVRMEPDTKHVYITSNALRVWCANHQVGYNKLLEDLTNLGVETRSMVKRMGTGTDVISSPVRTVRLFDKNNQILSIEDTDKQSHLSVVKNDNQDKAASNA